MNSVEMARESFATRVMKWLNPVPAVNQVAVTKSKREVLVALVIDDMRACPDQWVNISDRMHEEYTGFQNRSTKMKVKYYDGHLRYPSLYTKRYAIDDIPILEADFAAIESVFKQRNLDKAIEGMVRKRLTRFGYDKETIDRQFEALNAPQGPALLQLPGS